MKGAIFDFDGTLFDSMSIWERAGADYLASVGQREDSDLVERMKPLSLRQVAQYLQERYGLPMTIEAIMEGINKTVEGFYLHEALPKPGVLAFLQAMQARGIPMCIATATDRYLIEAALRRCGMEGYFGEIFTCTEVGHSKEEPHIYEAARDFLGTPREETAVFEDGYHGAKTAKTAGFLTVGVYDVYERHGAELKALADVYLEDYGEGEKLLLS